MKQYTKLNDFQPHPLKSEIESLKIRQFDLAHSLNLNQASLSRQLNGIIPMNEKTENEIQNILNFVKSKSKKRKKIRKSRA